MNINEQSNILITCSRGVSPFLEKEAAALGFTPVSTHETGVVVRGTIKDTYRLNLELRTALNVLFLLKEFRCTSPEVLYKEAGTVKWEDIIPPAEYISVVSQVNNPTVNNTMFANQKFKDAVVDRMTNKTGKRPDSGPERSNIVINFYWNDQKAWIYLNTSGTKLADRGYRKIPLLAPMRETLASAVVQATGYNGTCHFVNPMTGSGTLAIEAALIALGKAPGLLRSNFGLKHIKGFDETYWQELRKATLQKASKKPEFKIIATDIRPEHVDAAQKNAKTCGVDHLIEFGVSDFSKTAVPPGKGIVLLNPEYGERMGDKINLISVYKGIGDFFKKECSGYTGFVFTGNMDLAKKVGLRASQRLPFFTAEIECRLLRYDIY
ncbi:MAG: class I SAM-dependent RNA methyltransferase [Candidatus Omnitrophica bacterium]|nr:class I SAM-dependent RNA methyltransferase [Candidatus Omnitrophota bacterium]